MKRETMKIGNREFVMGVHTYVMGILNVTPDSFSDGGKWKDMDRALFHVEQMVAEGMDIVDVGGESTRPGYEMIGEEEEISRIAPVIQGIKARFDVPVSLDTYKAKVAEAGIRAGADMLNDIWGLKYDPMMAAVIAGHDIPCCLMHNRTEESYEDFLQDVTADLSETIRLAKQAGIGEDKIILDPGIGFAKNFEQNLEMLNHLESLKGLGYPVLLGCSRKSVIGLALDLPPSERLEGTLATTVLAVQKGCSFVRVHDVKENVRVIRMIETILGYR